MRDVEPTRRGRIIRGLVAVLVCLVSACATGSGAETSGDDSTEASADRTETYGDDPMGVAQRWADGPPEGAPDQLRKPVASWDSPIVLRVSRLGERSYRAILARSASSEAEAVQLNIERRDGGWRVVDVAEASARLLWSEM